MNSSCVANISLTLDLAKACGEHKSLLRYKRYLSININLLRVVIALFDLFFLQLVKYCYFRLSPDV